LKQKLIAGAFAIGILVGGGSLNLRAAQQDPPKAADNTKANQRDRSSAEPTSDQAKNNLSDRDIMQKIRKAVMDDKSLSTYAHNVKIISQNGKVTLKGPVRSEEEKESIKKIATDVAGAGNITDEITIKPDKKASE
jgi:hyperosmotically inducible periplasmic protein